MKIHAQNPSRKDLLESLEEDQDAGHVVDLELANIHLNIFQNVDEAYCYARKEYKKRPQNIHICKTMARIYYRKNYLEEANRLIEVASRTNKQDAEMFCLKGLINYKLGKTKEGIDLMNREPMINPFLNEDLLQEMRECQNMKSPRLALSSNRS